MTYTVSVVPHANTHPAEPNYPHISHGDLPESRPSTRPTSIRMLQPNGSRSIYFTAFSNKLSLYCLR